MSDQLTSIYGVYRHIASDIIWAHCSHGWWRKTVNGGILTSVASVDWKRALGGCLGWRLCRPACTPISYHGLMQSTRPGT